MYVRVPRRQGEEGLINTTTTMVSKQGLGPIVLVGAQVYSYIPYTPGTRYVGLS